MPNSVFKLKWFCFSKKDKVLSSGFLLQQTSLWVQRKILMGIILSEWNGSVRKEYCFFSNLAKSNCSYFHMNVFTGTKTKTVFIYNKVFLMNGDNTTLRQPEKNWSLEYQQVKYNNRTMTNSREKQLYSLFNCLHTAGYLNPRLFLSNIVLMASENLTST